ncbi:hypothetical protein S245_037406 [Arachis hypogaea]|nr:uncharacterized protein DS421_11g337140 [Arachis hypogaea]
MEFRYHSKSSHQRRRRSLIKFPFQIPTSTITRGFNKKCRSGRNSNLKPRNSDLSVSSTFLQQIQNKPKFQSTLQGFAIRDKTTQAIHQVEDSEANLELPIAIGIDGVEVDVRAVDDTNLGNGNGTRSGVVAMERVKFTDSAPTAVRVPRPPPQPPHLNSHAVPTMLQR